VVLVFLVALVAEHTFTAHDKDQGFWKLLPLATVSDGSGFLTDGKLKVSVTLDVFPPFGIFPCDLLVPLLLLI
jgi:hypothetical protein